MQLIRGEGELGKEMDLSLRGKQFIRGGGRVKILLGVGNSALQGWRNGQFQLAWTLGWLQSEKGGSLGSLLLGETLWNLPFLCGIEGGGVRSVSESRISSSKASKNLSCVVNACHDQFKKDTI